MTVKADRNIVMGIWVLGQDVILNMVWEYVFQRMIRSALEVLAATAQMPDLAVTISTTMSTTLSTTTSPIFKLEKTTWWQLNQMQGKIKIQKYVYFRYY